VAVLGGGAAGFFGAIACAEANPNIQVVLLEKTGKLLGKVRVSGGGRCNVTHACDSAAQLVAHYPRGSKQLKAAFQQFGVAETVAWFAHRGVPLKTEADGRMFPTTDSSETIARALEDAARCAGVRILLNTSADAVQPDPTGGFTLKLGGSGAAALGGKLQASRLLIATGGNPKSAQYDWLRALGHTIAEPVPSLFTFNVPDSPLSELMGVSVPHARVVLAGEKLQYEGPLLVTHWGVSGPAVLKLSAWGARRLSELGYVGTALINWVPSFTEETLRPWLQQFRQGKRQENRGFQPPIWPAPTPVAQRDRTGRHRPRTAVERLAGQSPKSSVGVAAAQPPGRARENHLQGGVRHLRRHFARGGRPENHAKPLRARLVFCRRSSGYRRHHGGLQLSSGLDHRFFGRPSHGGDPGIISGKEAYLSL
jgi:predicted Rossmann fold flavoprotein